jgi:excisionase family DNA binding protein
MGTETSDLLTIDEVRVRLGVSKSSVWRLLRRGAIRSVRRGGRRLVPLDALAGFTRATQHEEIPPFTKDHPILRLVGAGRSGGRKPGARNKHDILDR